MKDLNKLAKEIIEQNQYMTLATSDAKGNPWASPVAYAYDDIWNFYFVSIPNSKHCSNANSNKRVAVAIFDSQQGIGKGVGLQIEGIIEEVGTKDIPKAAGVLFKRKYPYGKMQHAFSVALKNFLKKKLYRFYRITPTRVWMNNPNSDTDVRIEIKLN